MRLLFCLILISVVASCATQPAAGGGRTMPGEAQPYAVLAWGCGMQPWPQRELLAFYPADVLYHLRVEAGPVEERVDVEQERAELVLADAERVGVLNRSDLEQDRPLMVTHGETRRLDSAEVGGLVARAEPAVGLSGSWPDSRVVDGCSIEHALWNGTGYTRATVHDDAGPAALDELLAYEWRLHDI